MGVARNQVGQALIDQLQTRVPSALAQSTVDRRCGDLNKGAGVDDRLKPSGVPLDLRVALRMGDHRGDPATLQVEHLGLQPQRPAEVGELEEDVRRIPCEAEAA